MRSEKNRLIDILEAAEVIGKQLFGDEWSGNEFASGKSDEVAANRSAKVHDFVLEMIRDGRVKTWTVDKQGSRWPLEREIATDVQFGVWLHDGTVCGIWGPETRSGCVFDRDDFHSYGGIPNPSKRGGRTPIHKWEVINNRIWLRIYLEGPDTIETISKEIQEWCGENLELVPDIADIRKRVRKIIALINEDK